MEIINQYKNKNNYLFIIFISITSFFSIILLFGNKWLIFFTIFVFVVLALIYYSQSLCKPFLAVLFIPVGSYLGYLFQVFDNAPIPFSLFQIFLLLSFVVYSFHIFIYNHFVLKRIPIEIELLIFLILIYFSLLYSPNREEGLFYATRFLFLLLMLYLFVNTINKPVHILVIILLIVFVSLVLGLVSIKEGLMNRDAAIVNLLTAGQKLLARATVVEKDPNIFGSHFFLPISFTFAIIVSKSVHFKYRAVGLLLFGIFLLSIFSTYSRSAWIAIAFALLYSAIYYKRVKLFIYLSLIAFAMIVIIPGFRISFINILNRFLTIFSGTSDYSSQVRIWLGVGAVRMFFDSFMLGVGFRGFPMELPLVVSTQKTFGIVEPHNVYYTVFAELGLIGIMIFIWILYKIWAIARDNFKKSDHPLHKIISGSLLSTFVAYLVFYQFYVDGLVDNNFWILTALIFSQKILLKKHKLVV